MLARIIGGFDQGEYFLTVRLKDNPFVGSVDVLDVAVGDDFIF